MYYYKILKIGDDFFYILYFVKLNIIDEKYASNLRSIFFYLYVYFSILNVYNIIITGFKKGGYHG